MYMDTFRVWLCIFPKQNYRFHDKRILSNILETHSTTTTKHLSKSKMMKLRKTHPSLLKLGEHDRVNYNVAAELATFTVNESSNRVMFPEDIGVVDVKRRFEPVHLDASELTQEIKS